MSSRTVRRLAVVSAAMALPMALTLSLGAEYAFAAPVAGGAATPQAAPVSTKGYSTAFTPTVQNPTTATASELAAAAKSGGAAQPQLRANALAAASSVGGTITRDEILSRAQSWVNEGVDYSQTAYWTDSNGTYRQDCSGFVSMAWHLSASGANNWGETTYTLPNFATQLGSYDDLQPGDMIDNITTHVVLFKSWTDSSHTVANVMEEAHTGTQARNSTRTRDELSSGGFKPFRYNNAVNSVAAPSVSVNQPVGDQSGTVFLSGSASGSGSVSLSTQFFVDGKAVGSDTGNNPVVTWDTTTVPGGTHQITAVTTASNGSASTSTTSAAVTTSVENYSMLTSSAITDKTGTVHVFRINQSNGHLTDSYRPKGGAWAAQDLNTKAGYTYAQAGAPAAVVDTKGGIHVFTRKADDGQLLETVDYQGNNTWAEESLSIRANYTYAMSDSPAAVVDSKGGIHVYTHKANDGGLLETVDYNNDNNWAEQNLSNRAGYTYPMGGSPAAVVDTKGGIHVFTRKADDGNLLETVDYQGNNTWAEESLSNRANYTYAMSDSPAAVVDSKGGIHVYTHKANDGGLLETVDYNNDNNWAEQNLSNRAGYTYPMGGSPAAVVDTKGGIHVFTRKADDGNLLETVDYQGNNTWAEESLNNRANYTYAMTGSAATTVDTTGGIHVFTQKPNDRDLIETVDYNNDNNWAEQGLTNQTGL
ncbi:Ig-like domain-containing protein [Kitasatospora sp. HPMI-4]|uniref:Ig-like domain-containing protein n=1 Tax=Kitasatospora sp. HPMI-4 TaxID=3448443 RepID=UPI003F1A2519